MSVRGYQFWGIPLVRLMRKWPWVESIVYPLALARAEEIAYQMGRRDKPNYLGKVVRRALEPLNFVLGIFVPKQDWKKLHGDMDPKLLK
jgi:hypothetical protein